MLYVDPEKAKMYRAETASEVEARIRKSLSETACKLKVIKPNINP